MSLSVLRPPGDEAILRAAPDTPGCASHARSWVLFATCLGSSVAFLEASVLNVALPAIQDGLHASLAEMQWIASAYTFLLAALGLVGAVAGNRYGSRRLFIWGAGVIAVASLAAAAATTAWQLVAARALQGFGAALLVPNSLTLLSASFPSADRGRAIGTWSAATAFAGAAGPLLGGLLVEAVSWRGAFLLVAPFALVACVLARVRVPDPPMRGRSLPLDWPGAALATVALGAWVFAAISSGSVGILAPRVLGGLVLGVLAGIGFVLRERSATAPMVPLDVFRSRSFRGINLVTLCLYFAVTGTFFLLPFNLVHVQGYTAAATGAAFLPFALVIAVLSRPSGSLGSRLGAKPLLVAGAAVTACGLALFSLPGQGGSYWTTFFPAVMLTGLGMALTVAPLTNAVMDVLGAERAAIASGVNNALARLATLLAVAIVGTAAVTLFARGVERRISPLALVEPIKAAILVEERALADTRIRAELAPAERARLESLLGDAFVESFRWLALIAASVAVAGGLGAAWLVDPASATSRKEEEIMAHCAHLDEVREVLPNTEGCEECLRSGDDWVHLRLCLTCGHVGCCDSSKNRHATRHFWGTQHPIVRSLERGEDWRWCYVDEIVV